MMATRATAILTIATSSRRSRVAFKKCLNVGGYKLTNVFPRDFRARASMLHCRSNSIDVSLQHQVHKGKPSRVSKLFLVAFLPESCWHKLATSKDQHVGEELVHNINRSSLLHLVCSTYPCNATPRFEWGLMT